MQTLPSLYSVALTKHHQWFLNCSSSSKFAKFAKHAQNFPKSNLLYPFHQACIEHDSSGLGKAGYPTMRFTSAVARAKKVCASKYQHPSMNYCRSKGQSYKLWVEKRWCLNRLIDVITADTRWEAGQDSSPSQDTNHSLTQTQAHGRAIKPLSTT